VPRERIATERRSGDEGPWSEPRGGSAARRYGVSIQRAIIDKCALATVTRKRTVSSTAAHRPFIELCFQAPSPAQRHLCFAARHNVPLQIASIPSSRHCEPGAVRSPAAAPRLGPRPKLRSTLLPFGRRTGATLA
jgi:hypothetical protein